MATPPEEDELAPAVVRSNPAILRIITLDSHCQRIQDLDGVVDLVDRPGSYSHCGAFSEVYIGARTLASGEKEKVGIVCNFTCRPVGLTDD